MSRTTTFVAKLGDIQTVLAEVAPDLAARIFSTSYLKESVCTVGWLTREEYAVFHKACRLVYERHGEPMCCEECGWETYCAQTCIDDELYVVCPHNGINC